MKNLLYGQGMVMSLSIGDRDYLTYMNQELDELEVLSNAPLPWRHEDVLSNDSIWYELEDNWYFDDDRVLNIDTVWKLFSKEPLEEQVWVEEPKFAYGPDWVWDLDHVAMKTTFVEEDTDLAAWVDEMLIDNKEFHIMTIEGENTRKTDFYTYIYDAQGNIDNWTSNGDRLKEPDLVFEIKFKGPRPQPVPERFPTINHIFPNYQPTPQDPIPDLAPHLDVTPTRTPRSPSPQNAPPRSDLKPKCLFPTTTFPHSLYPPRPPKPRHHTLPANHSPELGPSGDLQSKDKESFPIDEDPEAKIPRKEIGNLIANFRAQKRPRGRPRKIRKMGTPCKQDRRSVHALQVMTMSTIQMDFSKLVIEAQGELGNWVTEKGEATD